MTLTLILNDLRSERDRLADLYERMDKTFADEVGSWSSKTAVSDAIDAIDRAVGACPREVPRGA